MVETSGDPMKAVEQMIALWNTHNPEKVDEIYCTDYCGIDVTDNSVVDGPDGVVKQLSGYVRAFPDLIFKTEKAIRQDECVAVYWTARGTHQGSIWNIPPTGRQVQVQGMSLLTIENGKIKKNVSLWDMAGLLRSIGLLPELRPRPPLDLSAWL